MRRKTIRSLRARRARPSDLESLEEIEKCCFGTAGFGRRQIRYHLRNPGALFWVYADSAGRPVAYILCFFHTKGTARIYSLATHPQWRGMGLAGRLIRLCEHAASRKRAQKLVLEVKCGARNAMRLYESRGFEKRARMRGYYHDGSDAWKMAKKLQESGANQNRNRQGAKRRA